jgi:uncharacterized protein YggE
MKIELPVWRITHVLLVVLSVPIVAQDEGVRRPLDRQRGILVSATSEVSAAPDRAVVRLGMMAQNSRAKEAQAKVNQVIEAVVKGIKKAGVEEKGIRTASITLTPVYSEKPLSIGAPKVSAFRADNVVEVTVNDTKLIGNVMDVAIEAGANEILGISFEVSDEEEHRSKALASAAQKAKLKAETVAKALGVSLGNVMEVTESGGAIPYAGEGMMMARAARMAPTTVEPGQVRVSATVTLRYEIRERAPNN